MGNICLIKNFKGEVKNNNLPIFGLLSVDMSTIMRVISITADGGNYKITGGSLYTSSDLTTAVESEGVANNTPFYAPYPNTVVVSLELFNLKKLAIGAAQGFVFDFNSLNDAFKLEECSFSSQGTTRNEITGTIEGLVEAQSDYREIGDTITITTWSYTKITFHGAYHKSTYIPTTITFSENTVTVSGGTFGLMGTYNKATKTWTYE